MGFIWSKPRGPLEDSLIDDYPVFLRMGDLLLVPTSDLDITLNRDLWKHVALVISSSRLLFNGQLCSLKTFVSEYDGLCVRQLGCERPSGFEERFVAAVAEAMSLSYKVADDCKEGFQVAFVLHALALMDKTNFETLKPHHFSSESPYNRLDLSMYSKNINI